MEETGMKAKLITRKIREYVRGSGRKGAVLGLSGGIDSALCAVLAAKALGGKNVIGLVMPNGRMNEQDEGDAFAIAKLAGIRCRKIDVGEIANSAVSAIEGAGGKKGNRVVSGNAAARARMMVLYGVASQNNCLVLGTGNKSELLLGYFTKYGDGGCDILPIGDLYKREVVELARFLGVPEGVIRKKPSAGLWEGQTDEGEFGFSYGFADKVLSMFLEGRMDGNGIIKIVGKENREKVRKLYQMVRKSSHKRSPPRILSLKLGEWQ